MKTYKVLNTCTFQRRYLEKDAIVEFPDDIKPSRHLKLISGKVKAPAPAEKGDALSEIQKKQTEAIKPKTGFASSLYENKTPEKAKKDTVEKK